MSRYINLVYSAAFRQTGQRELAEEATQAVFVVLARRAASFRPDTVLTGWLLRTTRYTAANLRRREQRRKHCEQAVMNHCQLTEVDAAWKAMAPLLDEALCKLSTADRDAVALRFFEQKSFKEVGQVISLSENTARMRVTRALERLRRWFSRRGITLSVLTIGSAISANAVQAAPPGLAASVMVIATAKGAGVAAGTSTLVAAILKMLAWTRFKIVAGIGLPALLIVGTGMYVAKPFWKGSPNQLRNGTFEEGLGKWNGYVDNARSQARATFGIDSPLGAIGKALRVSVTQPGYYDSVELQQSGLKIKPGQKYQVSFRAHSTVPQPLRVKLIKAEAPWTFYGFRVITEITPQWHRYALTSRAMVTAEDAKMVIQCGGFVGDIWIDNVEFREDG